jgi:hypothetical protein
MMQPANSLRTARERPANYCELPWVTLPLLPPHSSREFAPPAGKGGAIPQTTPEGFCAEVTS